MFFFSLFPLISFSFPSLQDGSQYAVPARLVPLDRRPDRWAVGSSGSPWLSRSWLSLIFAQERIIDATVAWIIPFVVIVKVDGSIGDRGKREKPQITYELCIRLSWMPRCNPNMEILLRSKQTTRGVARKVLILPKRVNDQQQSPFLAVMFFDICSETRDSIVATAIRDFYRSYSCS